jgi:hypothetical protein
MKPKPKPTMLSMGRREKLLRITGICTECLVSMHYANSAWAIWSQENRVGS